MQSNAPAVDCYKLCYSRSLLRFQAVIGALGCFSLTLSGPADQEIGARYEQSARHGPFLKRTTPRTIAASGNIDRDTLRRK